MVSSYELNHSDGVPELKLDAIRAAEAVLQLAAANEYRKNFALTNIDSAGGKGQQVFLPGAHSDVGGGYVDNDRENKDLKEGAATMALTVRQIPPAALLAGAPLQGIVEPVQVVLAAGRDQASDYLDLPCAVVSERMRSALDRAGVDNIQYLRASLEQRLSERAITGYWIANVFGALACVDRNVSVIEHESESYAGDLRSFEFDLRATYDSGLFRVAEDSRLIAIHERVRGVLERAQLRGILYQAPTSYDGYPVSSARPASGRTR